MSAASRHRVGLHETDAAGVMFAGHIVTLAHSAYERAMLVAGCDLAALIATGNHGLPLVRCEAGFRRPIRHGQELVLETSVAELRERGFRVRIALLDAEEPTRELAVIEQIHACIDAGGRQAPLPAEVTAALERLAGS